MTTHQASPANGTTDHRAAVAAALATPPGAAPTPAPRAKPTTPKGPGAAATVAVLEAGIGALVKGLDAAAGAAGDETPPLIRATTEDLQALRALATTCEAASARIRAAVRTEAKRRQAEIAALADLADE